MLGCSMPLNMWWHHLTRRGLEVPFGSTHGRPFFIIGVVDANLRSELARRHGVDVFERADHPRARPGEHDGAGDPYFGP